MSFHEIKYSVGKPKRKINWALFISVISVCLSLFSFFFQNLRTTHLLKICMSSGIDENDLLTDTTNSQGDIIQSFQAVLHNYGNKYEAILQARIYYSYDSIPEHGFYKEVGEPFVIKPGEAILKKYADTQSVKFLLNELPPDNKPTFNVFFEFLLTGNNGELFKKYMYITNINIDTVNADLDYSRKYTSIKCDELVN